MRSWTCCWPTACSPGHRRASIRCLWSSCSRPTPDARRPTPDAGATRLLSEIDPGDHGIAFGLCDLGLGFPELGFVSLDELVEVRGMLGLPIAQDPHFRAGKRLSVCAKEARMAGRIQA